MSFVKIVKKSIFLLNISCLIFDSTKAIRLLARNLIVKYRAVARTLIGGGGV